MIISGAKPSNHSKLSNLKYLQNNCYWYIDDRFGYDWGFSTLIGIDKISDPNIVEWQNLDFDTYYEVKPFTYTYSAYKFNVKKKSDLFKWLLIDNSDINEKINFTDYMNALQNPEMAIFFLRRVNYDNLGTETDMEFSYDSATKIFTLTTAGQTLPSHVNTGSYIIISSTWNQKVKYQITRLSTTTFSINPTSSYTSASTTGLTIKVVYQANIRKETYDLDYKIEKINFIAQGLYLPTDYFTGMTSYIDSEGNMKIYGIPRTTMNSIFQGNLNISESIYDVVTDSETPKTIINGLKLYSKYEISSTRILVFRYSTDAGQKTIIATEQLFSQDYAIFPDSVISEVSTGVLNNNIQAPLYERYINDNYFIDSLMITTSIINNKIKLFNKFTSSISENTKFRISFCELTENITMLSPTTTNNERTTFTTAGGAFITLNGIEYACSDNSSNGYLLAKKYSLTSLLCSIKYDYFKVLGALTSPPTYPTNNIGDRYLVLNGSSYDNANVMWYNGSSWIEDTTAEYIFILNQAKWYKKINTLWIETFAGEFFKRIFIFDELNSELRCQYIGHVPRGRITINTVDPINEKLEMNIIL